MEPKKSNSLMRNLGAFFGHVARGVKTDVKPPQAPVAPPMQLGQPGGPQRQVVDQQTKVETREVPGGRMIVRETVVREIEMLPPDGAGGPDRPVR